MSAPVYETREEILTMTEETATIERRTPNAERRTPNAEPQEYPLISIIVPAYNCGKFIAKALDSLINQDIPIRNYEIIITDDGSTDQTGTICDTYAERFPFIHVTHTANFGASHARNVALPQCRGEYITFCDADDYVSSQLISVLTRAIDVFGRPDFLVWHYYNDYELPAEGFPVYDVQGMSRTEGEFYDGEELCLRILRDNVVGGFTWNKLIRNELAAGFNENLKVLMDHYWLLELLSTHDNVRVCSINYYLYCYVQTSGIGQTRDPARIYDEDGLNRFMLTSEHELDLPSLSPEAYSLIKRNIYSYALQTLYLRVRVPVPKAYAKLRTHLRNYAKYYYFTPTIPLWAKVKSIIKHVLVFLHIHKPRQE